MSWNWNEEAEVKEYETKGTVTIGTDEYRDLITEIERLRASGQKEHDDWYKELREKDNYKAKLDEAEAKLNKIEAWFEEDGESKTKFKLWKVEQEGKG